MRVKEIDYDKELELKRKYDPNRFVDPMKECTFKPEISQKEGSRRSIKDLYEWEMDKRDKKERQKLFMLQNQEQHRFRPRISTKSIKLAEKSRDKSTPLHERLMKTARDKEAKLQNILNKEKMIMFKPTINRKSKWLVSNKKARKHKKVKNGQTYNLEFYKAVPDFPRGLSPHQKTATDKRKSKKPKSSKKDSQLATPQLKEKKKKRNPHPKYASPYNRGILSAGIPLKTLLQKGEKHRSNLKKKARNRTEILEYEPGRGISQSRSKSKSKSRNRGSRSPQTLPFDYNQKRKSASKYNFGARTKSRASNRASRKNSKARKNNERSPLHHVEIDSKSIPSRNYAEDEIFFQSLRKKNTGSRPSSRSRGNFKF